jgi:uncharacterized protein
LYDNKGSNMNFLEQLTKQKYLNLETFRKNGESMKTPVWFVQQEGTIFVEIKISE